MAMDMNGKGAYDEWTAEERKEINYWHNRMPVLLQVQEKLKNWLWYLQMKTITRIGMPGTRHPKLQWCYAHTQCKSSANNTFGKD